MVDEEDRQCPVCLETVSTLPLECSHYICITCLGGLFENRYSKCMLCRKPIILRRCSGSKNANDAHEEDLQGDEGSSSI